MICIKNFLNVTIKVTLIQVKGDDFLKCLKAHASNPESLGKYTPDVVET